MGVIEKLKSWLGIQRTDQLTWLLNQADAWRAPNAATYKSEVARRRDYLEADMSTDALTLLKQEFPKLWRDIQGQRIEYPIAQFIANKRAQVFRGAGSRFYLVGADDQEIDPKSAEARTFAHLVAASRLSTALYEINAALEMVPEAAIKIWWDVDHCEVSVWWPDEVHVAINPERPWDPHAAFAVLFEMSGEGGINDAAIRYEVWGHKDPKIALEPNPPGPGLHFITSTDRDTPVNETDANPFRDRQTRRHVYPFAWFATQRGDVYARKGGDDLVALNRTMNLNFTWLNWHLHWGMTAIPNLTLPAGQADAAMVEKLKNTYLHSPKHAMALPPGVKMEFVSPHFDPAPFRDTFEMMVQYAALLKQLSPKHLDMRGGLPASGVALRIELDGLIRYNSERTEQLRPCVIDTLERLIIVGNEYMPSAHRWAKTIGPKLRPMWSAGQLDAGPKDYVELGTRFSSECEVGVSSYADWHMAVHGSRTKEAAEEAIRLNQEFNSEVLRMTTRYPEPIEVEADIDDDAEPKAKPAEQAGGEGEGVEGAAGDKIVANVYQIVKAIEVGAATAVDLRLALYPAETRDQATKIVLSNLEFNRRVADMIRQVREAEEGDKPTEPTEPREPRVGAEDE